MSRMLPTPATTPKHPNNFLRLCLIVTSFLALILLYIPPSRLPQPPPSSVRKFSRRLLHSYQHVLHLHPLESRAITAGFIFLIADFVSQLLQVPRGKSLTQVFSLVRLARYSLYGLFIMGPFLYLWYAMMNAYAPDDDFRGSLLKCFFEQVTLEPICISMYMIYDAIVCRKGLRGMKTTFGAKFLPLWFKNAIFWLPANFANYYIGTPDLRVIFANLCSLFWNIYFSGKVNRVASTSFVEKRFHNHDSHSVNHVFGKSASTSEHMDAVAIRI